MQWEGGGVQSVHCKKRYCKIIHINNRSTKSCKLYVIDVDNKFSKLHIL